MPDQRLLRLDAKKVTGKVTELPKTVLDLMNALGYSRHGFGT